MPTIVLEIKRFLSETGETSETDISGISVLAGISHVQYRLNLLGKCGHLHGMRILCLDIGTKRIGMAASDPLGLTAQPLCVIARRGGAKDFEEIARRCRELDAELLLVGLPLDEEGGEGPQAEKVRGYAAKLKDYLAEHDLDMPIQMWDERYSTAKAEERLIAADVSRARRREVIDKMAAVVILEDYLSSLETQPGGDEGALG
jgi:putative Holliday junction resolvase